MNIKRYIAVLHVVFLTLIIAGCGGGGGGGGSSGGGGVSSTITATNAVSYAATLAAIGGLSDSIGFLATTSTTTAVVVEEQHSRPKLGQLFDWQTNMLLSMPYQVTPNTVVAVIPDQNVPCPTSGSVDVVWNDADFSNTITSGDSAQLTYNACVGGISGDDEVSGVMNLDGLTVSGDWTTPNPPLSFTGTYTFTSLSVTFSSGSETQNGSLIYSISTPDGNAFTSQITGSLGASGTDSGFPYSYNFSNLDVSTTSNDSTGEFTADISSNVTNSDLGTYTVETLTTFAGNNNSADTPSSGSGKVTASDNSNVTAVILDAVNIRLDVDTNGDTVTDATVNTTWDALINAT